MGLNLADCILLSEAECADKTAIICEDVRLTYAELVAAAKRVANLLSQKGIKQGDKVAMMLPNTPHFPMIYYGALMAGVTVVPFNVLLKKREIRYQLNDCEAKMLIAWQGMAEEAGKAIEECPLCEHFIVVEPTLMPSKPEQGESFVGLLMQADTEFDVVDTNPDDTAVIIYTSAMSGRPLGTELTHYNLFQNALTIKVFVKDYQEKDVFLTVLPLFHSFGQTTMMNAPLLARGTVILMPRFDPAKVYDIIQKEKVSIFSVVPTMLHIMLGYKPDEQFDLSSLRSLIVGGSALSPPLAEQFEARFNVPVLEGYGLTETSPLVSFNREKEVNRPGSLGTVIWGCHVKIERPDGSFAEAGEEGEIVIRGHNVMKGYYKQPEATADAMRNGWLHTGDMGYMDTDGYLYITGLKKDMILRAGLNIYPKELELLFESHPAVREAAVIGLPDEVRGQEVKVFVRLNEGQETDEKTLAAWCRGELASYKTPRKIELLAEFPRTADGLIDKAALIKREDVSNQ